MRRLAFSLNFTSSFEEQEKMPNVKILLKFVRYDTEIGDLDVSPLATTLGVSLLDKE